MKFCDFCGLLTLAVFCTLDDSKLNEANVLASHLAFWKEASLNRLLRAGADDG